MTPLLDSPPSSPRFLLGIDPGWVNCGVAVLQENMDGSFSRVKSLVLKPRDLGYKKLVEQITLLSPSFVSVGIERFAAYQGVKTQSSESILMVIGALLHGITPDPFLFRAIDWKQYLLHRLNLKKPSGKLDKHFSFLAAETICNERPKTDHEADAVCIAFTAFQYHLKTQTPSVLPALD